MTLALGFLSSSRHLSSSPELGLSLGPDSLGTLPQGQAVGPTIDPNFLTPSWPACRVGASLFTLEF